MPPDLYDPKEPLLRCLQDSLAAWQAALHRVLAQSGISPDEWQLLLQLAEPAHAGQVRDADTPALPWLQRGQVETMLHALSDQGWLRAPPQGNTRPLPAIPVDARRRLERLRQAIKALQSAWVAPLSLEERGLMIAYLTKMQRHLDRCAPRSYPSADAAPGPGDVSYIGYRYRRNGSNRF